MESLGRRSARVTFELLGRFNCFGVLRWHHWSHSQWPSCWYQNPPNEFMWVPFLRSFPGNEADTHFFWGPKKAFFWGGEVHVETVYVFFFSLNGGRHGCVKSASWIPELDAKSRCGFFFFFFSKGSSYQLNSFKRQNHELHHLHHYLHHCLYL